MSIATTRPPIPQPATELTTSTIGGTVRIDGTVVSDQDLVVDGQVDGKIEMPGHKLTIGSNAKVRAAIKAEDVVIIGQVEGNVDATGRLELGPQSQVLGDISTERLLIREGAYFKGRVEIIRSGQS